MYVQLSNAVICSSVKLKVCRPEERVQDSRRLEIDGRLILFDGAVFSGSSGLNGSESRLVEERRAGSESRRRRERERRKRKGNKPPAVLRKLLSSEHV